MINIKCRFAMATVASAAMVVGCGGGSGSGGSGTEERTAKLLANTSITPWTSGSVGFQVTPGLAEGESMRCQIDDRPETDCATSPTTGRVSYSDLEHGEHRLTVKSGRNGSLTNAVVLWRIVTPEVLVYGGTPAGIAAALAAARSGRSVVLVEPSSRLGGMMAGGLSKSDVGSAEHKPVGGIAAEFFKRALAREEELGACSDGSSCSGYDFEPHVAGEVFGAMLAGEKLISIQRALPLLAVHKTGDRLTGITTVRGEIAASVFIDASYEGDLMVGAGIDSTTLREARLKTSDGADLGDVEDDAGFGILARPYGLRIDPYVIPAQPASGLIPFVEAAPPTMPVEGASDSRLMSYNYRLCVTDDPSNRIPFEKPDSFDPARYEGSARVAVAMTSSGRKPLDELYFNPARTVFSKDRIHFKYDLNGGSTFSTDMSWPAWNQAYPAAGLPARADIATNYRQYMQGLLYFWQTDPRFGALNAKVGRFGLCADEFADNGHWPYQLYSRETRRMVGDYVMNENDVLTNGRRPGVPDSVAMGGYDMDSHIRRITTTRINGRDVVVSEGFRITRKSGDPRYPVAYRSLLPRRVQASNLLNPVTLSATSMAYSSLRMEPTFMALGQAAGTAASMAIEASVTVQDVDVPALQTRLRRAGQVL